MYWGFCYCCLVRQQQLSCVRLFCISVDCSPPGSSVHGISQARILEWVAISYSKGSSQPRDWTWLSCIGRHSVPLSRQGGPCAGDKCSTLTGKRKTNLDQTRKAPWRIPWNLRQYYWPHFFGIMIAEYKTKLQMSPQRSHHNNCGMIWMHRWVSRHLSSGQQWETCDCFCLKFQRRMESVPDALPSNRPLV